MRYRPRLLDQEPSSTHKQLIRVLYVYICWTLSEFEENTHGGLSKSCSLTIQYSENWILVVCHRLVEVHHIVELNQLNTYLLKLQTAECVVLLYLLSCCLVSSWSVN